MGDSFDVIMAAYPSTGQAERDFDTLVQLVRDKTVRSEGVILAEHGTDGRVSVTHTGDHLGRKGLGWGGGVGLVVGLFAPPLLASVAVGGVVGGLVGKFARHKVDSGIEQGLADKLAPGTAVIIAVVDGDDRLAAEQVLSGSLAKSVAPMSKKGLGELKAALAEAAGKFSPDRTVLPIADRNFGGTMGRTVDQSVADWSMIPGPQAPEGAPNVLVVLIDDAGFGNPDTFGGPIATPALTRVQQMGLTYNRFHVTAVCSPTRAALLTGRNHHRVGFGSIAEYPGPFPGYTAARPRSCTALPRILQENGYVTGGFGKWHLTPDNVQGPAGPFDHWPQSWGFDHWWGFLSGAAGQYDPIITQDNSTLGVQQGRDGVPYYFPDDLTDKAVEWLHGVRAQDATRPWFMYYSTGCAHAPHHVARAWADKYKGKFDGGWDKLREQTFERQKQLGIIPAGTELTERPDLFPAWDSLGDAEKKLYARQMEVFAGYCENADWNVGRLLDAVEDMDDLDNTLIFYIWGDNGASMEGTVTGSFNEMTFLNGVVLDAEQQLQLIDAYGGIDALGGDHTAPHYAAAWAHAGNTPFQWGKQMSSHLGGDRDPMVVAWPARIKGDGDVAHPVHALHRRRPDRPGSRRHTRAGDGRRDRPGADGRHQLPVHLRRRAAGRAAHRAVLRDVRQPRHVQGRLVGLHEAGQGALGLLAGDDEEIRPRRLRPGQGRLGAVLPARRLLPGPRPGRAAPGQAHGTQGAVVGRGRAQPRAAAARRNARSSSACCRRCPPSPGTPSPGTCRTCSAAWCRASSDGPTPSRPSSTYPTPVPRASSSPTPTSSAGSGCGSTATACCTTPTRSSAWRPTSRSPPRRSRPAR